MKLKAITLLAVAALFVFSACSRAQEQSPGAQDKAADFSLEAIGGETIVLSEVLKNKMAVLDFWASWCPHCVKIMPELEKFYEQHKEKIAVIGVNIRESKEKVEEFAQKIGVNYPIVLDSDGKIAGLYQVRGIPTLVAIDQQGSILYSGHSLEELLKQL